MPKSEPNTLCIRVKPEDGSLLRLYFAGTERVTGDFDGGLDGSWNASTKFSDRDERVVDIVKKATGISSGEADVLEASWLTAFEDKTWPGGAEDLYFKPSSEKEAITPPPIIRAQISTIYFPLDLILLCIAVGLYQFKKRAKRRAGNSNALL